MKEIVAIPVWGEWHMDVLLRFALYSHVAAKIEGVKYIFFTDRKGRIDDHPAIKILRATNEIEYRPCDNLEYKGFSRDLMRAYAESDVCYMLPPDVVIGRDSFRNARAAVLDGKKLVMCAGMRTLANEVPPTDNIALSEWAVDHLHPVLAGSMLNHKSPSPMSVVFVASKTGVTMRAFHLHPFAVVNDGRRPVCRNTVDDDLVDAFTEDETCISQNREIVIAEVTQENMRFMARRPILYTLSGIYNFSVARCSPRHRWFFKHRILLKGQPEPDHADHKLLDNNILGIA